MIFRVAVRVPESSALNVTAMLQLAPGFRDWLQEFLKLKSSLSHDDPHLIETLLMFKVALPGLETVTV